MYILLSSKCRTQFMFAISFIFYYYCYYGVYERSRLEKELDINAGNSLVRTTKGGVE